MRLTSRRNKFGRKVVEDDESNNGSIEEMNLDIGEMASTTILIGISPLSLGFSLVSLIVLEIFKLKELDKSLMEKEQPLANESLMSARICFLSPFHRQI